MKRFLTILSVIFVIQYVSAQTNPLIFPFDKKYGQIEVGGPFVGVEFHKSRPLPSRISFYYPVANSIDLSTDYWKRDESRPFAFGVKIGNEKKKWIGREGWRYELSPHTVTFFDEDAFVSYQLKYEFCLNEPAMVITLTMINKTKIQQKIEVYSHVLLALRTCQTYSRKDSSAVRYISENQTILAKFSESDTKQTSAFVVNVNEKASRVWTDANELTVTDAGVSFWIDSTLLSSADRSNDPKRTRGVAAFEYSKLLQPGDTMTIVQVIGSSTHNEAEQKISTLAKEWKSNVDLYNNFVTTTSTTDTYFRTNDSILDRTMKWSKAILTSNAHYLNGHIVPMPCPAEYNFFFTHDLLMTNLGAVNYDLNRVKQDLLYVSSLAQDSIIPHAYYWRDDGFKTELCTPSNWNHLWFIEVSASYLRHSLDTTTLRQIYPLISKSLTEVMTLLNEDHLMHAYRPDWWDLGWKEGSRTYITALSIRAIEDYLFIASMIDRKNPSLLGLEKNAIAMRSAIVSKLWDDSLNYLINYNGEEKDKHKYMGSLIAPAYDLLDNDKSQKMIETAKNELFAPNLGIRAVMPSDFHKDSVIKYFKIAGNEAGDEYTYINGGVWPHNNAWFALALNSTGKCKDALKFVKQTMTIDGIANSPNGIPAMYEYRYSNESSPRYGEIDKPSFLWAGGFYIYTMYTLIGMNDNVWNLSVSKNRAQFDSTVRFNYQFDKIKDVTISGKAKHLESFIANGKKIQSLILPLDQRTARDLSFSFGKTSEPYLAKVNAIVHEVNYTAIKRLFDCKVSSFKGHSTIVSIIAQKKPRHVLVNGKKIKNVAINRNSDNMIEIVLSFIAGASTDKIAVQW